MTIPATCALNDSSGGFDLGFDTGFDSFYDGTVHFDIPWTEADDYDETWQVYQMFQSVVGG